MHRGENHFLVAASPHDVDRRYPLVTERNFARFGETGADLVSST